MLFRVLLAPLQAPAQRRIVTVPFRSVNSYILVEVSIDGRPKTLLVDMERQFFEQRLVTCESGSATAAV
jgi:hypothetical protein